MADRLTKADWTGMGLATLVRSGPEALKVGQLADALRVSRGSFYWHFRDVGHFREELLEAWREQSVERVIDDMASRPVRDRLPALLERAFSGDRGLDRAMRSWAAQDAGVSRLVTAVDHVRITYIGSLLAAAGVAADEATARADFIYWAYLGSAFVADPPSPALSPEAIRAIGDLFERP